LNVVSPALPQRNAGSRNASRRTTETAADIGELAGEVRIIRRMLASLLGVVLAGFGLLGAAVIQIPVRLP